MSVTNAMECDTCGLLVKLTSALPEDSDFEKGGELEGWFFDFDTHYAQCPDCYEQP
jgi:hypothetical protein